MEILEVHNDEPKENSASTTIDVVSSQCKDRALFVGLLHCELTTSMVVDAEFSLGSSLCTSRISTLRLD